jgi:aminoglycoside phosphotransferase (APT) family kinase protein
MADYVDMPRGVRAGEELDTEKLAAYLQAQLPDAAGPLEIGQFPSGFSNLTYFVRMGDSEYVLRRPPFGTKVKSAHDMGREYRILAGLSPVYPAAPRPVLYCDEPEVMGAPFYLMQRVRGIILRSKKPEGWALAAGDVRQLCKVFVEHFADLHALDYAAAGLGELQRPGWYVERQVNGWVDRYYGSQTDDIPAIEQAAAWLKAHMPPDSAACLIHGDFKWDNLVLDPSDYTKVLGVLDWEMATIGDPLMDLGTVLSYWIEPNDPPFGRVECFLTREPGAMTRQELVDYYGELTGRDTSNAAFYFTFALIKLAVIVQQIYYRYKQGLTKDERFANLIMAVGALGMKATEVIETGKISP